MDDQSGLWTIEGINQSSSVRAFEAMLKWK
jgi:hypothetical protein